MAAQEIRVPDIGDFTDVPIIEILVAEGDTVAAEDPLLTLESDKATLDVTSPVAGTITSLAVAVGDAVSQGSVIGTVEVAGGAGGIFSTAQQLGGALGVAVVGSVFFSLLETHSFTGSMRGAAPILRARSRPTAIPPPP